jgi:hypothetical protein
MMSPAYIANGSFVFSPGAAYAIKIYQKEVCVQSGCASC